jgi:hypothetical protein
MDVLVPVLGLQEKEFHDNQVGSRIGNHAVEKDDAVLQQEVADAHLPLPLVLAGGLVHRERTDVFKLKRLSHAAVLIRGTPRPEPQGAASRQSLAQTREALSDRRGPSQDRLETRVWANQFKHRIGFDLGNPGK